MDTDPQRPPVSDDAKPAAAATPAASSAAADPAPPASASVSVPWVAIAGAVMAVGALALAWSAQHRVRMLEQELVARQQQSLADAQEALTLARQAQDSMREGAARVALLEARVADATVQRSQLDELIQSLSRSRDENLLADLEAALRVAQQQSALTGSSEALVNTLRQADERLSRYNQPRLERVRRAVLRDLDRVRSVATVDVPALVIRLDEVARQVDDLPLLGQPSLAQIRSTAASAGAPPASASAFAASAAASPASAPRSTAAPAWPQWLQSAGAWFWRAGSHLWTEVHSLVRISRVERPEAALAAPEQLFFLRENLKLRLLNARLALLSRQFDVAQSDLRDAQNALARYFDPQSRRVVAAQDLLRQVSQQARQVTLPRPEETLAALAAVNAGR